MIIVDKLLCQQILIGKTSNLCTQMIQTM